jgi:hypothetical protein
VVIQDSILSALVYNFYNTDRETGSVRMGHNEAPRKIGKPWLVSDGQTANLVSL